MRIELARFVSVELLAAKNSLGDASPRHALGKRQAEGSRTAGVNGSSQSVPVQPGQECGVRISVAGEIFARAEDIGCHVRLAHAGVESGSEGLLTQGVGCASQEVN